MPLFWLGLCFTAGILAGVWLHLPEHIWLVLLAMSALFTLAEFFHFRSKNHPLLHRKLFQVSFGLLAFAFLLGAWRFQCALPDPLSSEISHQARSGNANAQGIVVSDPQATAQSVTAVVQLKRITIGQKTYPIHDKLHLRMPSGFHLEYGDALRMQGKLNPVLQAGQSPTRSYLATQGITWRIDYPEVKIVADDQGSSIYQWIYALRAKAQRNLYNWMPFPESALLSGILLGIDWNIPDFLRKSYRATGTLHIIAISGYNIALLTNLVSRFFRRIIPSYWNAFLAGIVIAFYTILVGADPAVTRAAVMGLLALPAYWIGRRVIGINLLTIAAACMLMGNPLLLWNISFQLSFLATLGLMTLADPLASGMQTTFSKFASEKTVDFYNPLLLLVTSTLAAQFAVSPVVLQLDPALQLFSLPANLIILSLQPLLMALGGLTLLVGLILPPAGALLARLAWLLAALSNRVAVRMSLYPAAEVCMPDWAWIPAGVLVFALISWMSIRQIMNLGGPQKTDR